ncbi:MAG: aspartate aminotransferase family protein [Devosiaceae bacterium]|nr:aspartate aminotransferase family protein [Devosiaceae bacterium]
MYNNVPPISGAFLVLKDNKMSALYNTYARSNLNFTHGEGMRLFTDEGTSYLDFYSGIGVNALGHNDKALVSALKNAAEKVWHVSNLFQIEQQEKLAKRLVDLTFADAVFFTNSGTEAVECAIKTARHYYYTKGEKQRTDIITFKGAFHGRTFGAIAAGGNPSYLEGFGEPLAGFIQVETGDIELVEKAIDKKTCAILIEPVQGEGGVNAISDEFIRSLRELCDRHDLLLILDEVQCGYGRTGKLFAYQSANIEPDIMAIAKGIGAGFPLGACLAKEQVAASMLPGTHGSTYGGNPLACTIGNVVLDRMMEPDFLPHVERMGQKLNWHLQQLAQKFPQYIKEIRGKGLMVGIKITPPIAEFVALLRKNHLLAIGAGDNVLRLLPPLIVSEQDITEAIDIISASFEKLEGNENE